MKNTDLHKFDDQVGLNIYNTSAIRSLVQALGFLEFKQARDVLQGV